MRQNTSRSSPASNTAYPGSNFTPGSMIVITRKPCSASVPSIADGSGNRSASQVNTRYPSMYSISSHSESQGTSYARCSAAIRSTASWV